MRFLFAAIFALVALFFSFALAEPVALTSETFQPFLDSHDLVMVEFFAPWCGHCKALKPEYESASAQLEGIAPLTTVDCTVEKDLCGQHGVKGFPTVKTFRKGSTTAVDYKGARKTADIVAYVKKQTQPALVTITSSASLNELKTKVDDVLIVAYLENENDIKEFNSVTNTFKDDFTFALVSDATLATELGASIPSVTLLKLKSEPGVVATTTNIDDEALVSFIRAESFPLFGEIGPDNFQRYVDRNIPIAWFFLDYEDTTLTPPTEQIAHQVATAFKGKVSLVKLDGKKWAEHGKHFGVNSNKLPGIVIEDREGGNNFLFNQDSEVSVDALSAHIQGYLDGTLTPFIRSQPVPTSHSTAVFTLVGSTFEQEVLNSDKDVLVEFYAPWCGHCKSLAPKYEKLAEKFASNKDILIAAMDATENDAEGVKIKGFPTLIFWPKGQKDHPKEYDGERTEEGIEKFIRQHGTTFQTQAAPAATPDHDHAHDHSHDEL